MSEPFYVARARVEKIAGVHGRAQLEAGAKVEGVNEVQAKHPVLTSVRIHYTLRIPPGSREIVDRALASHQDKCPTAASLARAIDVSWTADIEESPA